MTAPTKTRILFMGTPEFAAQALRAAHAVEHVDIVGVYTQPPRPANRGKKPTKSAVHKQADALGLNVFCPLDFKSEPSVKALKALRADLAIVVAYGLILPKAILSAPKLGCVNIHASLLPRWRGAAPIQRAIEAGDQQTGVCLMQMDQGLDTGDVIAQRRLTIEPEHTTPSLHNELAELGAQMIVELLTTYPGGGWPRTPQTESGRTYAQKIDKSEAKLEWTEPAETLARKIRAFAPSPGTFFQLPNKQERIKVLEAHAIPSPNSTRICPGTVIKSSSSLDICCGDGNILSIQCGQRAGKVAMPIAHLLRGLELKAGDILAHTPMEGKDDAL